MYPVLTFRTVATADTDGCSARVTDRLNLALKSGNKAPRALS